MKNFLLKSIMVLTVMAMLITTGCGSKSDPGEEIKKAVTPVITPNGGTFTNSTSVTMSTETANGIIRYTLDGTTPSETSVHYNTAITIDKTTTIKAKTFKDGMYSSDVATAVITIQNSTTEDATLQTISVKTMPTKVSYLIGETLNITGLVIEGTYSDGSKKTETVTTANITGFSSSTAGTKTLTVTISGKTATFNVTVSAATLQTISVKTMPTKVSYLIGETLNITGLVIEGTYSDGSKKTETVTTANITGFSSSTAGTKTLTVTISGKTATFNVTVSAATLQTISVKTMPTKVSYLIGETLNITGLVIEGTYSDGSKKTETVTTANITGFSSSTAGTKTLTVTISGKTATFNVTVNNAVTKAEFTLIRKIDIMGINEYSAQFEVSDSRIAKLIFEGSTDINPKEVTISNKIGSIASFMIAETVTSITVKAVDSSGNQLGDTKTVTFSN